MFLSILGTGTLPALATILEQILILLWVMLSSKNPSYATAWWSFSSCTTTLKVLENNMYLGNTSNRTIFSVEAINGRTIHAHSHFNVDDEILLLPGTRMVVQSLFSPRAGLHMIHLKQIRPEEVLLEPPFEGI